MNQKLREEWKYRYEERLGILCGSAEPTPEQILIAKEEADADLRDRELDYFQDKIIQRDLRNDETL